MREIKFRAWDKKKNKILSSITVLEAMANIKYYWGDENGVDLHTLVIQQFTGLTDRRGKEIYEGDILHFKYDNRNEGNEVVKDMIQWLKNVGWGEGEKQYDHKSSEVIGNIYENPELIKLIKQYEK
jgi:hypothetical protein